MWGTKQKIYQKVHTDYAPQWKCIISTPDLFRIQKLHNFQAVKCKKILKSEMAHLLKQAFIYNIQYYAVGIESALIEECCKTEGRQKKGVGPWCAVHRLTREFWLVHSVLWWSSSCLTTELEGFAAIPILFN